MEVLALLNIIIMHQKTAHVVKNQPIPASCHKFVFNTMGKYQPPG